MKATPEQLRKIEVACHEGGHALIGGVLEGRPISFWTIHPIIVGKTRKDLNQKLRGVDRDGGVIMHRAPGGSNLTVNFAGIAAESFTNFLPFNVKTKAGVLKRHGEGSDELDAWKEVEGYNPHAPDAQIRACLEEQYARFFELMTTPRFNAAIDFTARYMLQRDQEQGGDIIHKMRTFLGRHGISSKIMRAMRRDLAALDIPGQARAFMLE